MQKILIIDDSKFARIKIGSYIKKAGYELIEAENGSIGFDKAILEKPDCIICDILMPVMDGFEFVEKFTATGSGIPIINMTADIQNSTKEKILKLGSSLVLQKPPKKDLLISSIKDAIARKDL